MKLSIQNIAACLLLSENAAAFSTTSLRKNHGAAVTSLQTSKASNDEPLMNSMKAFGVAASILAFGSPAFAETQSQDLFYSPSSIQIAETIKTMDFSLPSSYDAIADVKKDSIGELSREENLLTGTVKKAAPKKATERVVLQNLTDEEKQAKKEAEAAERKADKEAAAAEKQAAAAEKKAEKEALDKERAADKAAANKAKAEEKKAKAEAKAKADAKKEEKATEKSYDNVEFVDTGLPSYGDSTATRGRGTFSL